MIAKTTRQSLRRWNIAAWTSLAAICAGFACLVPGLAFAVIVEHDLVGFAEKAADLELDRLFRTGDAAHGQGQAGAEQRRRMQQTLAHVPIPPRLAPAPAGCPGSLASNEQAFNVGWSMPPPRALG